MAIIKKSTNSECWRGCGKKGTLFHSWWECKLVQPLWKTVWRFLKKLKIGVPVMDQRLTNLTSIHEDTGSIPDLAQWVKDLALPWAVAQVVDMAQILCCYGCGVGRQSYSSNQTPSLGTSLCHKCSPKKTKDQKKKQQQQLKIELPYDPGIPLLDIYPEKTMTPKDTCIPIFIAAIYATAKTWKQPKYPSTEEWIKMMCHIYIIEYYSAIKKEWNKGICSTMDGLRNYCAKWS